MKSSTLLVGSLLLFQLSNAQVGIGTTTPGARLDITKPGGDTPTLNVRGSVNISHFNFGVAEDTYIRGGKSTSNVILADLGSGKVGLGTSLPGFPLNFASTLGDKIALWGNSGNHYGFGIQSAQLQIHTDGAGSDVVFGYGISSALNETMRVKGNGTLQFQPSLQKKIILYPGGVGDAGFSVFANEMRIASDYSGANITMGYDDRSAGFTERMRVMGNGNVGIGVTDPQFKLDLADRMRIRSGGGFSSAGLYLNNSNNSASPAFIGMDDDTHVGFWGSGVGWKFSMNTQTGALKINGSEGSPGQVITSNGSSQTTWSSPTKAIYDNTIMKTQTGSDLVLTSTGVDIPNLTYTFTISGNAKVLVRPNIFAYTGSCAFCSYSSLFIDIQVNNAAQTTMFTEIPNGQKNHWMEEYLLQLGPGTYTIKLVASALGPTTNIMAGTWTEKSRMVIQVIPE